MTAQRPDSNFDGGPEGRSEAPLVVFFCTGNICRSPVAEVLARKDFAGHAVEFASAGVEAPDGWPASRASVAWAAAQGLDLAGHRSRPVTVELARRAAWLIGMTRAHAAIARARLGTEGGARIGMLGAPGLDLRTIAGSPVVEEVADPYGEADEAYARMGAHVRRLLAGWAETFAALAADRGHGT